MAFLFNDLSAPPSADLGTAALERLQCNILRSVACPRSTQVFHRFATKEAFATWLSKKAPTPSSANQQSAAKARASHPQPGDAPLVNVLFSAAGLRLLGLSEKVDKMKPAFRRGARDPETLAKLGDVATDWREHKDAWHAVELHAACDAVPYESELADHHYVVEFGTGIDADGKPTKAGQHSHGHFKVLDGLSTPVYSTAHFDALFEGREPKAWDPRHKLSTLLVRDELAESGDALGSYFVFRKYKQDVAEFERRLEEIAAVIEQRRAVRAIERKNPKDRGLGRLDPEDRGFAPLKRQDGKDPLEAIKYWIFGRSSDGVSVSGGKDNDFNYEGDQHGSKCPFHAHVRKVNPRGLTGNAEAEHKRTIARRGISYVKTQTSPTTAREETGLLFWCAQADIEEQFEYIMEKWVNSRNVDFDDEPTPDVDTLIGSLSPHLAEKPANGVSLWDRWKTTSDIDFNVWSAITLVGADYFYAPSLDGFTALKHHAEALLKTPLARPEAP